MRFLELLHRPGSPFLCCLELPRLLPTPKSPECVREVHIRGVTGRNPDKMPFSPFDNALGHISAALLLQRVCQHVFEGRERDLTVFEVGNWNKADWSLKRFREWASHAELPVGDCRDVSVRVDEDVAANGIAVADVSGLGLPQLAVVP